VVLQALADVRERAVVATTAAAQVRELQLRLKLRWRTHTPAGRELTPPAELRCRAT
jgi:LPS-assembly lipoprotein